MNNLVLQRVKPLLRGLFLMMNYTYEKFVGCAFTQVLDKSTALSDSCALHEN